MKTTQAFSLLALFALVATLAAANSQSLCGSCSNSDECGIYPADLRCYKGKCVEDGRAKASLNECDDRGYSPMCGGCGDDKDCQTGTCFSNYCVAGLDEATASESFAGCIGIPFEKVLDICEQLVEVI